MVVDSRAAGVIGLLLLVALIWFVISRARKGYQMLSAVMQTSVDASAESTATAQNAVHLNIGHQLGESASTSMPVEFEEELRRRITAYEAQERQALAGETFGLPRGSLSGPVDGSDLAPPNPVQISSDRRHRRSLFRDGDRYITPSGGVADYDDRRGIDHDHHANVVDIHDNGPVDYFARHQRNDIHDDGGPRGAFDEFDPDWQQRNDRGRASGAGLSDSGPSWLPGR